MCTIYGALPFLPFLRFWAEPGGYYTRGRASREPFVFYFQAKDLYFAGYDAKNMMHTFRLLHMAEEIATQGVFSVRRTDDRDFLLSIRRGDFEYDDLVTQAENKIARIDELFEKSRLPAKPDRAKINQVLIDSRTAYYR